MSLLRTEGDYLVYDGCNFFKQRLILSLVSGKPVRIIDIRADEVEPGLKEFEVSLIRILDKMTNGTQIEINKAGTAISFRPGALYGGHWEHDCSLERGIGYYLEVLIALGPFCKEPLDVVLRGITNSKDSPSVDIIKCSALNVLCRFLVNDEGLELNLVTRGLPPLGGGVVRFKCPTRKSLCTIQLTKQGVVKRVRGVAYANKVSPELANRTVEAAKGDLLKFLTDIYIHTDHNSGKKSGKSPGFGIFLQAETTQGVLYTVDRNSHTKNDGQEPLVPENLGKAAVLSLLDEIYRGGCCDSSYQWLVALFMALGQKNVATFLTGKGYFKLLSESPLQNHKKLFLRSFRTIHRIYRVFPETLKRLFISSIRSRTASTESQR